MLRMSLQDAACCWQAATNELPLLPDAQDLRAIAAARGYATNDGST
jgi:hypothetical protein